MGFKISIFTGKLYQFIILVLEKKKSLKLKELNTHSKKLEKEQQNKPKERSRKKNNRNKCRNKTESKVSNKYQKAKIV